VLEKFVVTGSNIPMAADALVAPVTIMGPQQIEATGVSTNVLDVLRKAMPSFSGNGNIGNENANIASGSTFGGSSLSMHNLTTLVLVNGRRMTFSPANASGGNQFVDVNLIPLAAIARIEVLAGGASAIYGSDAVSGVVNIILKSDYKGFEVGGHYGTSRNEGHYSERSAYVIGGAGNGKTSVTVAAQYSQSDPLFQAQRGFSNPAYGTTNYPGVIDVYNLATNDDLYYTLKPGLNSPKDIPGFAPGSYTIEQLVANGTYVPKTQDEIVNGFNLAQYVTLLTEQKRKSVFVNLDHQIAGDKLSFFGSFIYSNTTSQSQINGQPLYPYLSTPTVELNGNGSEDFPPAAGTQYLNATLPLATNPFSQAYIDGADNDGAGYYISAHNRFITFPRIFQNDTTLTRVVAGFKGRINEDYTWEIGSNLNRSMLDYHNPGVINTSAFVTALNAGLIDPFAMEQKSGLLPGNYVGTAQADFLSTLNQVDAKITGTPLQLPGGKLAFAAGVAYTRETLSGDPDVNSIPDENGNIGWTGATSFAPFNASRRTKSGFIEVQVPIFGPAQAIKGLHSLEFNVAGRYENYTNVGSSKVPKFSVRYQPFDEQLTFRASAGQSFSAPDLYSLYGPTNLGFTGSITFDKYTGGTTPQVQFNVENGSNPDLQPSKAHTWTAGFVYSPKQVKGLTATFDFFEVVQTGLIGTYGDKTIAQDVELRGTASPYVNAVHFGSFNGTPITGPGQLSTANPNTVYFTENLINLAGQKVRGFDANLDYRMPIESVGTFTISSLLTVYNSYRVQALPTERYYQFSGYATGGGPSSNGTIPKWRTFTSLTFERGGYGATVSHSYIPSVQDIGPGGSAADDPVRVSSYQTFDVFVSYDFKELSASNPLSRLKVRLGVNNIGNKMPPLAPTAFPDSNVDIGTYSPIGRLFFVDASYKF